jgi:hypothetical protein
VETVAIKKDLLLVPEFCGAVAAGTSFSDMIPQRAQRNGRARRRALSILKGNGAPAMEFREQFNSGQDTPRVTGRPGTEPRRVFLTSKRDGFTSFQIRNPEQKEAQNPFSVSALDAAIVPR